jgi:hypothetical protein
MIANGKVAGLSAAQVASISAALSEAADELTDADQTQVSARAASLEATRIAQQKRLRAIRELQHLKYTMKGLGSQAHEFDCVGFDPPVLTRRMVTPQAPFELSAAGYSNGVNSLTFSGNNSPSTVTYIIEAKIGMSDQYAIVGTSRKQSFKHTGVKPGEKIQYRIRAQTARGLVSAWSNEAIVYRL